MTIKFLRSVRYGYFGDYLQKYPLDVRTVEVTERAWRYANIQLRRFILREFRKGETIDR